MVGMSSIWTMEVTRVEVSVEYRAACKNKRNKARVSVKIVITYLIRVFDTTWRSKFWALKFLFLGPFFNFSC